MPRNTEIKIRFQDEVRFLAIEKKAIELGLPTRLLQEDTYYPSRGYGQRNKLRIDEYQDGSGKVVAEMISYKRNDDENCRQSLYAKSPVPDVEDTKKKMTAVYGPAEVVVVKMRKVVIYDQTRIHLDKLAGLDDRPYFLELEVMLDDNQSHEDGQRISDFVLDRLGITQEERTKQVERGSYRELLMLK